jgi:hypothetical protein
MPFQTMQNSKPTSSLSVTLWSLGDPQNCIAAWEADQQTAICAAHGIPRQAQLTK